MEDGLIRLPKDTTHGQAFRVYVRRASRGDRDHRHPGIAAPARDSSHARGVPPSQLSEQFETNRAGHAELLRYSRRPDALADRYDAQHADRRPHSVAVLRSAA